MCPSVSLRPPLTLFPTPSASIVPGLSIHPCCLVWYPWKRLRSGKFDRPHQGSAKSIEGLVALILTLTANSLFVYLTCSKSIATCLQEKCVSATAARTISQHSSEGERQLGSSGGSARPSGKEMLTPDTFRNVLRADNAVTRSRQLKKMARNIQHSEIKQRSSLTSTPLSWKVATTLPGNSVCKTCIRAALGPHSLVWLPLHPV